MALCALLFPSFTLGSFTGGARAVILLMGSLSASNTRGIPAKQKVNYLSYSKGIGFMIYSFLLTNLKTLNKKGKPFSPDLPELITIR
jgi:hypothetical protein